jgi:diguanylate cyclase (GGDEF)-like protein
MAAASDNDSEARTTTRTLDLLQAQVNAARVELAGLRRQLAQAREEFSGLRSTELKEADGRLVSAAFHADTVAQTVISSLDELTRHSQHDELTGAPNRALMLDRLESAIALAQRRATRVGVLFVDLDRFKQINDTHGHAAGDEVLQLVTSRLQAAVRDSDTVSRHSGDEFLVLLAEIFSAHDAVPVAEKMLASLAMPARIGPHDLRLSASIGIAIYPEDGADAATLIQHADTAMYRAKGRGTGGYEFFAETSGAETELSADVDAAAAHLPRRNDSLLARHEARLRELSNANRELLRTAQIAQKLQAHAEEAHRRQITFVAMAAHAMRTPLSVIRMTAATLPRRAADSDSSGSHEVLKRQTAHLARLIDDLLDGSLIGGGEFKLDCSDLDIDSVVSAAVDVSRHAMDSRRQRLRVQPSTTRAMVHGDPMRLAQVFSNLLNNASRRSPEGGDVWLTTAVVGTEVHVSVSDDGPPLSAAALPTVFDMFALDAQASADEPGLGIGLAVVKELAKAHGGNVTASSPGEKRGAKFLVKLPLLTAPRPPAARNEGP